MTFTDLKLDRLPRRLLVLVCACCMIAYAFAADSVCDGKDGASTCSEPEIGNWDTWRFVLNNKSGGPKGSESEAIDDAIATLRTSFPCGLSYAITDAPYAESAKVLSWTAKEDAARLPFAGFVSGANGNCQPGTPESIGTIAIRRERRVRCPRSYGWLIRENLPTVCIKD